jgi:hypothetical protein
MLFDSRNIAIPVGSSTSFEDLQAEALRRASRLGVSVPQGELVIRLDSGDGPIAFSEDMVVDILELNNKPVVFLSLMLDKELGLPSDTYWVS